MERIELSRGVHLSVLPHDKLKTNYLSAYFVLPLEEKNASLTALVPKVLSRGCRAFPDMISLNDRMMELYATSVEPLYCKRAGAMLFVGFSADYIKDEYVPGGGSLLDEVLSLMFMLLFDPLTEDGIFGSAYVASEKEDLIRTIRSKINNKAAYAKEKCASLLHEGTANGLSEYGTVEQAEKADARAVYERYYDIITRYPLEISACGDFDTAALKEKLLSLLPACPVRSAVMPKRTVLSGEASQVKTVTERMPVAQGKLVMGLRAGTQLTDEYNTAMLVFNELFGGSPQSKLFVNVREAKSLCYYCRSNYDPFTGAMFIQSGIETKNRETAEQAILAELNAAKNGEFTDRDIDDAKRSIVNSFRELSDNGALLALWHASRTVVGISDTPSGMIDRVMAVTKEQIVAAGRGISLDTVFFLEGEGEAEEPDEE